MATSGHGIKILNSVSKTHPESSIAKSYIKTLTWPQGLHTDTSNSPNYLQNIPRREKKSDNESDFKKTEKEYSTKKSYFTSFVNKSLDLFYQIPSINKLKGVSYEAITNIHADWKGSSSQIHSSVPTNGSSPSIPADISTHVKDVPSISSISSVSCEVLKISKAVLENYTPDKKSRSKSIGCLPDKKMYNYNTQMSTKSNDTKTNFHNNEKVHQKLRNVQSEHPNLSGSFEKLRKKYDYLPSEGMSNDAIPKQSNSINEMAPVYSLNFGLMSTFKNYINQKLPYMVRNCSTQGYTGKRNDAYSDTPKQNNLAGHYNAQVRPPPDRWINSSKNLLKHIKRHVRDKSQKRPSIRQQSYQTTNYKSSFDDIKPLLLVLANAKQMAFEMKRLSKPKSSSEIDQLSNPMVMKKSEYIDRSTVKRNINLKKRDKKSKNPLKLVNIQSEHCNKLNNTRMTLQPKKLYENKFWGTNINDNTSQSQNESLKMTQSNFIYPPLKLKKHKTSKKKPINKTPSTNSNAKFESKIDKPDNLKIKYQPISEKTKLEHLTFVKKQEGKDVKSNPSIELSSRIKKDVIKSENNRSYNTTESNEEKNDIKESNEKDKEKYGKIKNYLKVTPPANREVDLWMKKQTQPSPVDVLSKPHKQNLTHYNKAERKHSEKISNSLQTLFPNNTEKESYVNSLKKPQKGVSKLSLFLSQREDNPKPENRITLESLLRSQLKKDEHKSGNYNVLSDMSASARKNDMFNQVLDRGHGSGIPTMNYDAKGNRFKDYFQGRLSRFESNTTRVMTDKFYQPDDKTKDILQADKMKTHEIKQEKIPITSQMDKQNNSINHKELSETLTDPIGEVTLKDDAEVKKTMTKNFLSQIEPKSLNVVKSKINYNDPFTVRMHDGRNYLNEKYYTIDAAKSEAETSLNLSKFYLEKPGRSQIRKFQFYSSNEDMKRSLKSTSDDSFVSTSSDKEIKKTNERNSFGQNKEAERKEFSTYEEILQRNQAIRNKLIKNRSYMSNAKKMEHKEPVEMKSQSFMDYFMSEFHKKSEWIKEKENNNLKDLKKSEANKLAFHEPKNKLQPSELTTKLKNHSSIPEIRNDVIVHRFSNRINKNKWRYQNEDHSNYWRGSQDKRKFLHNNLLQPNSKIHSQKTFSSEETDKVSNIESEKVFKNDNFDEEIFESDNKGFLKHDERDSYFKSRYKKSVSAPDRKSFKPFIKEHAVSKEWPTYDYSIEIPRLSTHDLDVNSPTATNGSWFSDTSYIGPSMKSIRVSIKPNNDKKL